MRAVYIIGEGQTEERFVNQILQPYLSTFGIYDVRCILISTSRGHKGGSLGFERYRRNIVILLKKERDIIVTSLIDFYQLHTDFPQYDEAQKIPNRVQRVDFLENAIAEKIDNHRFIPYIQLHEFEGLLFSDIIGFQRLEPIIDIDLETLTKIIEQFPNPELINDGKNTHPAKRLTKATNNQYKKVEHGERIAKAIGIETIRKKCPRFNAWLDKIIEKMTTT